MKTTSILFFLAFLMGIKAVTPPTITKQPENATFAKQSTGRFYVSASNTDGGYLTYEWFRSEKFADPLNNPNGADKTAITAKRQLVGTSSTLTTITPSEAGYYYYWVEITNHKNEETALLESAIVMAKVVDATLPDHIINGSMEYWRSFPIAKGTNGSFRFSVIRSTNYFFAVWKGTFGDGNYVDSGGTIHAAYISSERIDGYASSALSDKENGWYTTHYKYMSDDILPQITGYEAIEVWEANGSAADGSFCVELGATAASSLYQEIATVPGKIYEWSMYHRSRSKNSLEKIAVVIGKSITEENDYSTSSGVTNRWNKDKEGNYYAENYHYGVNNDTYFNDIVSKLVADRGTTEQNIADGTYRVDYNGSTYYVDIRSNRNATWTKHPGVYTVPAGQGYSTFAFVYVYPRDQNQGNAIDAVVFASGTPVSTTQNVSYINAAQLSAATRPGYAYGIAEIRGSTAIPVNDVLAYYDSDGAGATQEVLINDQDNGWYFKTAPDVFAANGLITFKNLVPGKVYRIVGIPANAIDAELHVNERPSYVLDEGYYEDIRILPASEGNDTTVWNIDLEVVSERAIVSVINARSDVEYALLANNKTDLAHAGTGWTSSITGKVTFNDLNLGATYYLVSRPLGYSEVTYAQAAESNSIEIKTPSDATPDILDIDVRRPAAAIITVDNSVTSYKYAIVDPETGKIIAQQTGTGNTNLLSFPDLVAGKTYQVKAKTGDIGWMKGVRVYPYPDEFTINYLQETVTSAATVANPNGYIPTNVSYHIQGKDAGKTWIVSGAADWENGTANYPVDLGALILNNYTKSILDSLETLAADAELTYRIRPGYDGYEGQSVSPGCTLAIPQRPVPPAEHIDYSFNYTTEKITVGNGAALHFEAIGAASWTPVAANGEWSFTDAGWGLGSSQRPFYVRFPAVDTGADKKFASSPHHTDTIPARPDAPSGFSIDISGSDIVVSGLENTTTYQHKEEGGSWANFSPIDGTFTISDFSGSAIYYLRYAATDKLPASFDAVVSTPLTIRPVIFTAYRYGEYSGEVKNVEIVNFISTDVSGVSVALKDDNASPFILIGNESSITVVGDNTNRECTIKANNNLDAGSYTDSVRISYTYIDQPYTVAAAVYLRIDKADWNMTNIKGEIKNVTAEQLILEVTGAPLGAILQYYFGSTPVTANQVDNGNNTLTVTFTGLTPATVYHIGVKPLVDKNHNEPQQPTTLVTGYTAYATPNFDAVIKIDYRNERLTFDAAYPASDYTVTFGNDTIKAPYSLTELLDTLTAETFTLSLVHNAGVSPNPPFPASEADSPDVPVDDRPDAPANVTSTPSGTGSNHGTIQLAGQFLYRPHNSATGWLSAENAITNLGATQYDVRRPWTDSPKPAFASKYTTILVPSYANAQWKGTMSGSWNEAANWKIVVPAGAVLPANWLPDAATNVWIPGKGITYFPQLTAPAACNNIYLMQGAQLGGQRHLTYSRAHIQFDFGLKGSEKQKENEDDIFVTSPSDETFIADHLAFSAGHSGDLLERKRWYMLSVPLQGVVSGDFAFGDYPRVFMRKFNNVSP
ncbi:MAG: hypothetical protein LBC40_09105, partial [Dysgonamonadaceae bacterium]|nr:hypothetical protein [Dysgonamonadaceae bacterium]